jgi:hypothetical protein
MCLDYALGHLSEEERAEVEPVLITYLHVFHGEVESDFRGTDVIEHRIITDDATRIRKSPYRVPYALRDDMKSQVKDMLDKGVIRESSPLGVHLRYEFPRNHQTGSKNKGSAWSVEP